MRRSIGMLALALTCISTGAYASPTASAGPDFRGIENSLEGERALNEGRTAVVGAIPPGTPVVDAETILQSAGAQCKPKRHDAQTLRCIYNDVRIGDNSIDHVQWNTLLHTADGKVVSLSVDREIDRHSTQD